MGHDGEFKSTTKKAAQKTPLSSEKVPPTYALSPPLFFCRAFLVACGKKRWSHHHLLSSVNCNTYVLCAVAIVAYRETCARGEGRGSARGAEEKQVGSDVHLADIYSQAS
jgi:hypothetical protein